MRIKSGRKTTTEIPRVEGDGPMVHPGEILKDELDARNLTQTEAARRLGTTLGNLNAIVTGKRSVSADMAIRLEELTGVGARLWLNLQTTWDLKHARARAQRVA